MEVNYSFRRPDKTSFMSCESKYPVTANLNTNTFIYSSFKLLRKSSNSLITSKILEDVKKCTSYSKIMP